MRGLMTKVIQNKLIGAAMQDQQTNKKETPSCLLIKCNCLMNTTELVF